MSRELFVAPDLVAVVSKFLSEEIGCCAQQRRIARLLTCWRKVGQRIWPIHILHDDAIRANSIDIMLTETR